MHRIAAFEILLTYDKGAPATPEQGFHERIPS
jgi:hypothetical protein